MIKIVTLIGARPQIVKAAAISRAIRKGFSNQMEEVIVHSGQHYDKNMSEVFFEDMGIPKEKYNLKVGSASHAVQTAKIMIGFEETLLAEKPDAVLLYGDTNSTFAAALVAVKMDIPVVHVEGGVRSFDKSYPEEINRLLTDNVSSMIFVCNQDGMKCLDKAGFDLENTEDANKDKPLVVFSGDIMYDNAVFYAERASKSFIDSLNLKTDKFVLVTMHRHNVSEENNLKNVIEALEEIAQKDNISIVYPIHPRIRKLLQDKSITIKDTERVKIIDPISYTEMVQLEKNCNFVITDSGGVQKEAFFFQKPCLIMLDYTPWVELIENGTAILTGYSKEKILNGYEKLNKERGNLSYPNLYGDGKAAEMICEKIIKHYSNLNNE